MSATLYDRDLGYHKVLDGLVRAQGTVTLVGIHEEEGAQEHPSDTAFTGPTMAAIAASNEFGSEDGVVPERSYLRSTVDQHRERYADELQAAAEQVVDGKGDLQTGVALLGAIVEGDVKATITDLRDPPNAPATIERKGSSNPLIDTGHLRAVVRHEERRA